MVVEDDRVGGCQVNTQATSTGTEDEDEDMDGDGDAFNLFLFGIYSVNRMLIICLFSL